MLPIKRENVISQYIPATDRNIPCLTFLMSLALDPRGLEVEPFVTKRIQGPTSTQLSTIKVIHMHIITLLVVTAEYLI
jgi:hypothetical protein